MCSNPSDEPLIPISRSGSYSSVASRSLFSSYGDLHEVIVILDKVTGKSKGYGHAGITILPLFFQASPQGNFSDDLIEALTEEHKSWRPKLERVQLLCQWPMGGALFVDACLKGLNGVPDVVECSFVQSTITELPFFASKVRPGKNGVEEVLDLGSLSDFEKKA